MTPDPAGGQGGETARLARLCRGTTLRGYSELMCLQRPRTRLRMGSPAVSSAIALPGARRSCVMPCAWAGAGGAGSVLGPNAPAMHSPFAALVNGALAHSFELDAGTRKGVGAHPFGTVFTAALPMAQDRNAVAATCSPLLSPAARSCCESDGRRGGPTSIAVFMRRDHRTVWRRCRLRAAVGTG